MSIIRRLAPVVVFLALLLYVPGAHAATFTVTKTADTNDGTCNADCSLREAVAAANALAGADTITIPAAASDYLVSGATGLIINQSVTVNGAGAASTQINGAGLNANVLTFEIDRNSGTVEVTIQGVTIKGMNDGAGGGAVWLSSTGDYTNKTVNLNRVIIRDNIHTDGGGGGVGVFGGVLNLTDSTLAGNKAGNAYGGGGVILITTGSAANIVNSTITNNSGGPGAGIKVDGLFGSPQSLVVRNSTISANTTAVGGGAISSNATTPIQLSYNTIAGNTSGLSAANEFIGASLTLKGNIFASNTPQNCNITDSVNPNRQGFNFDNANTCRLGTAPGVNPNDHPNTTVTLGPLQDNGGPTFTHALPAGSAAIDAGGLGGCTAIGGASLSVDQRGTARPQGSACESGSFEALPPPSNSVGPAITGTPAVGQLLTCSEGIWAGGTPQTYTFGWLRDGAAINGANASAYTVVADDAGRALICRVTATNAAGSVSAESAAVSVPADGGGGDSTAPIANLTGRSRQDVDKLSVTVGSNEDAALEGSATVKLPGGQKKLVRSRTAKANVTEGRQVKLRFKFARKTLRAIKSALKRGKHPTAKITITATDAAGNLSTVSKAVKLKD